MTVEIEIWLAVLDAVPSEGSVRAFWNVRENAVLDSQVRAVIGDSVARAVPPPSRSRRTRLVRTRSRSSPTTQRTTAPRPATTASW